MVTTQLIKYLIENDTFSHNQFGFRPGLSTENAFNKILSSIYTAVEENKISMLILLDLSKAFDSVNHNILLHKLLKYNIDTFWFSSYLDNRKQSVRADSYISDPLPITFGVPQGSILGPILFNIFINDLLDIDGDINGVSYADDLQIMVSESTNNIGNMKHTAEDLLTKLKKWYDNNGLLVNTEKTQLIFLGTPHMNKKIPKEFSLNLNGSNIYPSKQVTNLGVILD